ncbi:MAG: 3-isopropylmalate dehydrogenase [Bacteroidota bacterium]
MQKHITVIEGDGIGPEVVQQGLKVLHAIEHRFGHNFTFSHRMMGAAAIDVTGNPLPEDTIESCLQSDAILLGAVGDPKYDNDPSAKVRPEQGLLRLRKELQLFANIRPIQVFEPLIHLTPLRPEKMQGVDFVIYRELTSGIYFGEKGLSEDASSAYDICSYTEAEIQRIAHLAFQQAGSRRKKVTLVDKANVLETSRLWRRVVQELALGYPDIELEYLFVDNAAMQIILNPQQFDVMLTGNMFGDILSDESSVLSGSLGMLPSASIGKGTALFEPVHGSYPQAAGMDIANPMATILAVAMMLDHFQMQEEAAEVRKAVNWALTNNLVTKDIDPSHFYGTSAIGDLMASFIEQDNAHINHSNASLNKSTII